MKCRTTVKNALVFIRKLKSTDNISNTVKIIDNNYKSLSYRLLDISTVLAVN